MTARSRIVLFHTMDPRGTKLGGIETHVRLMLAHHPAPTDLLFVGIDETGDLEPGRIVRVPVAGRTVDFLPVAHVATPSINRAAKSILQSTTPRYALGLLRHLVALYRATRGLPASAEIERFEFALVPKLLRLPLVVIVHNEGTSRDEMDSLLKRYWFLHLFNERLALALADRIFAVNPSIATRIESLSKALGRKTEVMSVSVDTKRFVPTPFSDADDAFRVCFAGRLDAFKDPSLMFATLARLSERLAQRPVGRFRRVAFDYVGASDVGAVAGHAAVDGLIVRHGIRTAAEVAGIMARAHCGIITSFFEGMPCYLLEMLASGRPVAAIRLPQFDPVIVPGVSGAMVERGATPTDSAERLVTALQSIAAQVAGGGASPSSIAVLAQPFSVEAQLHRLLDCHQTLSTPPGPRQAGRPSTSSA